MYFNSDFWLEQKGKVWGYNKRYYFKGNFWTCEMSENSTCDNIHRLIDWGFPNFSVIFNYPNEKQYLRRQRWPSADSKDPGSRQRNLVMRTRAPALLAMKAAQLQNSAGSGALVITHSHLQTDTWSIFWTFTYAILCHLLVLILLLTLVQI